MPDLKGLRREAEAGNTLMVSPRHAQWVELPQSEQQYSDEAVNFVAAALRGEFKRERAGRISPSSLGDCRRRVAYGFYGAKQDGDNLDSYELMGLGTWGHLRWQAEGLTTGWLAEGEVWTYDSELQMGGSMDGILHDGSVFELKTAGLSVYSRVVSRGGGLEPKWRLQTPAYLYMSDRPWASQVVEERSTGRFHEFRIARTVEAEKEMLAEVNAIRAYLVDEALPPKLPECVARKGEKYRQCPFRTVCGASEDTASEAPEAQASALPGSSLKAYRDSMAKAREAHDRALLDMAAGKPVRF